MASDRDKDPEDGFTHNTAVEVRKQRELARLRSDPRFLRSDATNRDELERKLSSTLSLHFVLRNRAGEDPAKRAERFKKAQDEFAQIEGGEFTENYDRFFKGESFFLPKKRTSKRTK
jgi:hypothetical protein